MFRVKELIIVVEICFFYFFYRVIFEVNIVKVIYKRFMLENLFSISGLEIVNVLDIVDGIFNSIDMMVDIVIVFRVVCF